MPESLAVPLALGALVLALAALLMALMTIRRGKIVAPERPLPALTDLDALEAYLGEQEARLDALSGASRAADEQLRATDEQGRRALQNVGVVRYNPFDDTGSNQSFALALVDAEGNGVVLSSLHSRQQTRLYLKEIVGGQSDAQLSGEETEALRRAALPR
ncbi:hypothetical protein BH20CHL5_BH20CHL5_04080 [soil metagenome]|nr:DUF4446 family protein [Chloroflexota bacterium]